MHQLAKKIIVLILLFLFIEKAGLRLFIHARYHEYAVSSIQKYDKASPQKASITKLSCDCLDDFFLPLHNTKEITIPLPVTIACAGYKANYNNQFTSSTPTYFRLRGPPVTTA